MISSMVLIALIGTLQFNSAISAAISYEPIKITVNENFNAQPGRVFPGLQEPGILHQGANFYFKPQLNLPPSYIPSHIEGLISFIQQHHYSCSKDAPKVVVEKDKLIEILKPFMYPMSEISKETQSEIVLEKENNLEIVKPIIMTEELKPVTRKLLVIAEVPGLPPLSFNGIPPIVEEEVKNEESVILEESKGVLPEPTIIEVEPKPFTSELVVIPEAPALPPLSLHDIPSIADEEVKEEESIIFDKPIELLVVPEAPVLPPLSFNGIPPFVEEEVKKEESIILEEPTDIVVKPITEPIINYVEPSPFNAELVAIPEAQELPPLSANDIHVVEEEVKIKEPIVVEGEPKPIIQELVAIPEAPVLPSLLLHNISSMIEEEVEREGLLIFEGLTRVFPTIPGIDVRPIGEPIISYVEPKSITSELVVIPEAPVLPPLSFNRIAPIMEEEVEKEESIILEAPTELVAIPEAPLLAPLSANDIHVVEEEVKIEEPIIVDVEPKPAVEELLVIPEAPVLPLLSNNPVVEEIKLEESLILEEPIDVSPPFSEISVRPIGLEPFITDVEPRTITPRLVVIPEAPVLPQLSYNGIPPIVEDVKIEESIKVEKSPSVFPSISEISEIPFPEPKVVSETAESFALENNIFPFATEEVKIEVPILFEESIEVFPTTAEIFSGPTLQESEITDSYVLEEVSQPNPERVVTIKETLPHTIIPKPSNNMKVFSYAPFVSHLSNRAPNTKKLMIPKPASIERYLHKKHPFRLPVTQFPKLDLNIWGNEKQFLYPKSYAHDIVEKRIAPNMAFKNQNAQRVQNYIRSNVPKGSSYL